MREEETEEIPTAYELPVEFLNYRVICFSSLETEELKALYQICITRAKTLVTVVLDHKNLKYINSEKFLFIFGAVPLPAKNKMNIIDALKRLREYTLEKISQSLFFRKDYASVDAFNVKLENIIEKFDEGYGVIVIEEVKGRPRAVTPGSINIHQKKVPTFNDLFFEISDGRSVDEPSVKDEVAQFISNTPVSELPVIQNKKIIGTFTRTGSTFFNNFGAVERMRAMPLRWDYISDEIAKDIFGNSKILLSSNKGLMRGFFERFSSLLNVTIYNDSILEQVLAGEFDILILRSNVWIDVAPYMQRYYADILYYQCLIKEIHRQFKEKNISWYIFDYAFLPDKIEDRTTEYLFSKGVVLNHRL